MDPNYEIFDLLVERHASGYRARVLSSPAGNESADLQQTISAERLQSFLFEVGKPRHFTRRVGASITEETKKFGSELLRFLFPDRIWACLERSRVSASSRDRGLRIQIRLSDVPELCDLPWEFLYHDDVGFLALSTQTPIVRYLETRRPSVPLSLQHPLRILVLISGPKDLARLDVDREWTKLRDAVTDLEAKGLVTIERLDTPRLSPLNRRLKAEKFHILHFIGHGNFDHDKGSGQLFFEDDQGRSSPVSAAQVATALRDHQSVRLVILNACEGARSSRTDPFAGTAQTLIRAGVPAVIAMQFEITDDAAITFSSELYTSIALGDSVDRSLSEARKAISLDGNELEWATPVLYLRSPDSRIFALPQTAGIEKERTRHGVARLAAVAARAEEQAAPKRPRNRPRLTFAVFFALLSITALISGTGCYWNRNTPTYDAVKPPTYDAVKQRAMSQWKLKYWDDAVASAQALSDMDDLQVPPSDRAFAKAMPALIRIEQAHDAIFDPQAQKLPPGPRDRKLAGQLAQLDAASARLDDVIAGATEGDPITLDLLRAELMALRDKQDALLRLRADGNLGFATLSPRDLQRAQCRMAQLVAGTQRNGTEADAQAAGAFWQKVLGPKPDSAACRSL